MTSTLPYDRRGSYSILHNHLRSYEQARLQKLADGNGNEAARASMRLANVNLQADAARRVQQDSDATLVGGATLKPAELADDSDTEAEDDTPQERDTGAKQVMVDVTARKEGAGGREGRGALQGREKAWEKGENEGHTGQGCVYRVFGICAQKEGAGIWYLSYLA
jgi:hypothetical protein